MIRTTKKHSKYWADRKIDWKTSYFDTWNHPHRDLIAHLLQSMNWHSLWEVGIGGGANTLRILQDNPDKQIGGCDVSQDAIDFLTKTFKGGMFQCEAGDDMMMSDGSVDVVLSDMCLIYVDPRHIQKYLKEMFRVTRNNIILCEFHSESWWKRLKARLGGYHVYNYKRELEKAGFYGTIVQHIPEKYWPGTDNNSQHRAIIIGTKPNTI